MKRIPDEAIIRLGKELNQHIATAYPHWQRFKRLKEALENKLYGKKPGTPSGDSRTETWEKQEAIRRAFDKTQRGKKANREYKAFSAACDKAHDVAVKIARRKPTSLAGAAVYAIAAVYDGEWGGFGFSPNVSECKIVSAMSRAAGIKIPDGMRECVKQGLR